MEARGEKIKKKGRIGWFGPLGLAWALKVKHAQHYIYSFVLLFSSRAWQPS
jgi:hypothetical protein